MGPNPAQHKPFDLSRFEGVNLAIYGDLKKIIKELKNRATEITRTPLHWIQCCFFQKKKLKKKLMWLLVAGEILKRN